MEWERNKQEYNKQGRKKMMEMRHTQDLGRRMRPAHIFSGFHDDFSD